MSLPLQEEEPCKQRNAEVKDEEKEDKSSTVGETDIKDATTEVSLVTENENQANFVKEDVNKVLTTSGDTNGQTCASSITLPKQAEKNAKDSEAIHPSIRLGSGFEIVGIKDRHGQLRKAVPIMPMPLAIICCLINVCLPGIGTLISAFTVFCCGKTEYETKSRAFILNILAGLLQILTVIIIVGWIWSIIWGVTFVTIAANKDESKTSAANAKVDV